MTPARDTTAAARGVQLETLRRLDGPTRLRMAFQMSDDAREVSLSGVRHRHPDWSEESVHAELLRLMLGGALSAVVIERIRVHR